MIGLPERFIEKMKGLLGEEYAAFEKSYGEDFLQGLRLNRIKVSPSEWERLSPVKMEKIGWIDNGYYFDEDKFAATKHPFYYAGLYYIQEPSAQTPANLLDIREGDKVLDLCAAPGGKSTELAAKLNGSGVLVSNDISATRAKALLKNLGVFGIKNALITSETPDKLSDIFSGYFDKILVDAPCSGEGMFRKVPAVMKNWEQYGTAYYNELQKNILPKAYEMLAPDGLLLYSTCTFSPDENEGTVDFMLSSFPDLEVLPLNETYEDFDRGYPEWIQSKKEEIRGAVRIWPHRMKGEGHFLCLFHKKTVLGEGSFEDDERPVSQKNKQRQSFENIKTAKLFEEEKAFLEKWGIKGETLSRIELHGDKFYLIPKDLPNVTGLRILRNGLYLGDRKKGRFEPSQPFAMSLTKEESPYFLDLKIHDTRVEKYLKCETIEITDVEKKESGIDKVKKGDFILIGVEGKPLGFAKLSGTTVKNKYFAGWRMM